MPRAPTVADLRAKRDAIRLEIAKLNVELGKLKANEALLSEMLNEGPEVLSPAPSSSRAQKGSVKATVLALLDEVGTKGLNATSAVEMAETKGIRLERGSVSSLLSRLKTDGAVVHDGDMYRLKNHSEPPISLAKTSGFTSI